MNEAQARADGVTEAMARVAARAPSGIGSHGLLCCRIAEAWFASMAQSIQAQRAMPPSWLRERWEWGPVAWPVHWCEAMAVKKLDCGALAALGRYAVEISGGAALPVQLVERADPSAVANWRAAWQIADGATSWMWDEFLYHEAIALVQDGAHVSLWDTTHACCIDRKATEGYGSLVAVRISASRTAQHEWEGSRVFWKGRQLELGQWYRL